MSVITIAMARVIETGPDSVWRALTQPSNLFRWDERLLESLDAVEGYPAVGSVARWRYRLGAVPVVLEERPIRVEEGTRLDVRVALGMFNFAVSHALAAEEPHRTRLVVKLGTRNSVAVVGGTMDRFDVRRVAAEFVDSRIRALQKWCENQRA